jgi:hypothetical protein
MKPAARRARGQILALTLAAGAAVLLLHRVSGIAGLAPADFVAGGPDALEFCDPTNPRFLAVVARSSPVTLTLTTAQAARTGAETRVELTLRTASGKPIGRSDLATTAGEKMHLWLVDPTLRDFHRAIPQPGLVTGRWSFAFTPRAAGLYRIFVDFTPVVTAREIYASVDLAVAPRAAGPNPGEPGRTEPLGLTAERAGYHFILAPSAAPVYARQLLALQFTAERIGGGMVPLVATRGAFVHLIAFDEHRTGFANLADDARPGGVPPDPFHPGAAFRVTFADPGRYVLWSWFLLGGQEVAVPFSLQVLP